MGAPVRPSLHCSPLPTTLHWLSGGLWVFGRRVGAAPPRRSGSTRRLSSPEATSAPVRPDPTHTPPHDATNRRGREGVCGQGRRHRIAVSTPSCSGAMTIVRSSQAGRTPWPTSQQRSDSPRAGSRSSARGRWRRSARGWRLRRRRAAACYRSSAPRIPTPTARSPAAATAATGPACSSQTRRHAATTTLRAVRRRQRTLTGASVPTSCRTRSDPTPWR